MKAITRKIFALLLLTQIAVSKIAEQQEKIENNEKTKSIINQGGNALLFAGGAIALVALAPVIAGFTGVGVAAGSLAAGIQSSLGTIAAGSLFSSFQSLAMTGTLAAVAKIGGFTFAAGALGKFLSEEHQDNEYAQLIKEIIESNDNSVSKADKDQIILEIFQNKTKHRIMGILNEYSKDKIIHFLDNDNRKVFVKLIEESH